MQTESPNASPQSPSPHEPTKARKLALQFLLAFAAAAFAFTGFLLYINHVERKEIQLKLDNEREQFEQGLGPKRIQQAGREALAYLKSRPEFQQFIGEQRDAPIQQDMQPSDDRTAPNDLQFRMTIRGTNSDAWYYAIVSPDGEGWRIKMAYLILPDKDAPKGRKRVDLLIPARIGKDAEGKE